MTNVHGWLGEAEPSSILLLAGAREAGLFALPAGTDLMASTPEGSDP
jgi:hypothetical protein